MEQHQEDGEDVIMEPAELEHECDSAGGGPLMSRRNAENVEPAPSRRVVHLVKSSAAAAATPKIALVHSTAAAAANKLRIDRIAENLKINLQQKEAAAKMKEQAAPKVSVVALAPAVKPPVELQLAKRIKEEDELERHDADLTNLAWLGTFNLAASVGLPANYPLSLSPPISPPLPPVVSRVQVQAARPVQVQVRKYAPPPPASAFSLSYGGDEADGGGGRLKDISALLKPYLSGATTASPSPSSKAAASLQRPPYSFSCLTFLAIESSQRKRLSVKEIYNWITQNFPYYRSVPSGSWKNSIRHNLSYNHCFAKVDKNLLAMRDFSGKGSLWCINPEYRPLLVDTLLKMPMNSEQHQLACIPFLQDVAEVPKSSTTAVTSSSSSSNLHDQLQRSSSLTPSKAGGQAPSRTKSLVKHRSSSLIGHKTPPPAHQLTTTIINPRIASRFMASGSPVVSQLTQIAHRSPVKYASKQSSKQAADHSDNNCSEMDAVNALLSMKSNRGAHQQPTPPEPKTPPPTSRRKQVFKTPTKKLASKDYAMDDDSDESWNEDNFFDEPAAEEEEQEEEDIDQPEPSADQEDQEDDDDEIEEGQVLPPTHHLFKAKRAFELPTTSSRAAAAAQMTSKKAKLLVKFPCFKSKAPAAQDEGDEQADESANMNALLELSLAAKLVEEQKQQQLFKPVQSKRVRKN